MKDRGRKSKKKYKRQQERKRLKEGEAGRVRERRGMKGGGRRVSIGDVRKKREGD